MRSSSLENKTVRPGFGNYSYYHSDRHAQHARQQAAKPASTRSFKKLFFAIAVLAVGFGVFSVIGSNSSSSTAQTSPGSVASKTSTPAVATKVNNCAGNALPKFVSVSISARHLWSCEGQKTVYESAVITGMEQHASTLTPLGTYKIYAKKADTVLTGSDETGTWKDPVAYWMPFLDNQYGTYGFHDAGWRTASAFGKIDPNSSDASHGCVELPMATSAWLYNWAEIGTTVTVKA